MMISAIQNRVITPQKINFKSTEQSRERVQRATEEWQRQGEKCDEFWKAHKDEIFTDEKVRNEYHSMQDDLGRAYARKVREEYADEKGRYPSGSSYYYT